MDPNLWLGVLVAAAFALSWAGTGAVLVALRRIGMIDNPNHRSSHVRPTPRGGGIAPVLVAVAAWWCVNNALPGNWGALSLAPDVVIGAALALAMLSMLDDLRGLPWLVRLLAQALAVTAALISLPPDPVFQGLLNGRWDMAVAGIVWLWFINAFNFMDGIDGIAGTETMTVGIGVALVAAIAALPPLFGAWGLCLAAAAAGFLLWNWQPAKVFLGDAGSIPLGYLVGWLLLMLAAHGQWVAALLLPLYFLADASLTLARRLAAGARPWVAHRTHLYQRAAAAWGSHAAVVLRVAVLNMALLSLAVLAVQFRTWVPLAAGLALTVGLLWYFDRTAADHEGASQAKQ